MGSQSDCEREKADSKDKQAKCRSEGCGDAKNERRQRDNSSGQLRMEE